MKFKAGDEIDYDHCNALYHEFLRCEDSFKEFQTYAMIMIMKGQDRWISYKTYNAYANFIHHLYEFLQGCLARDNENTEITKEKGKRTDIIEGYITHHINRILTNRRDAILAGNAPDWENDVSYYPEKAPTEFSEKFRKYRNKVNGHVAHERTSKLSLSDFYTKYHKYLYMLYEDSIYWWAKKGAEFPDLKEITNFSVT